MHWTRRQAAKTGTLALLGIALSSASESSAWCEPTPNGLAGVGAKGGIKVGIQCGTGRFEQPVLGQFLQENFDLVTAPLKWANLRPAADRYDFTGADQQFIDAKRFGFAIHGHNLCWNTSNPAWFDLVLDKSNARDYLESYISTVAGRYRGRVDSWDVVNEPVATWDGRADNLRSGPWVNLIGPEYLDLAFHTAKAADPFALRTINLNGCEEQNATGAATRAASLSLIKSLLKRGVPIQAAALEAHLDAPWRPGDAAYIKFIRDLRDSGIEVYVSECDVNDTAIRGTEAQVKAAVAQTYRDYLTDVFSAAPPKRLIFWSMSDRFDWYGALAATQPRWRRPDGQPHHLGLTDENFAPNPAYYSVLAVLSKSVMTGRAG